MRKFRISLTVICAVMVLLSAAAFAQNGEKLLLGFEKAECEKWAAKVEQNNGATLYYTEKPRKHLSDKRIVPVKTGDATEGKQAYAYKYPQKVLLKKENFNKKKKYVGSDINACRIKELILYSSGWFEKVYPRNWSGYDLFRMDIKSSKESLEFLLEFEDEDCAPPVSRRFVLEPGDWVTLEVDLNKMVTERGVDLNKMTNMWIYPLWGKGKTEILIDNIRLAKKDSPLKLKALRDESSMKLPDVPDKILKREPVEAKPDTSPLKPGEPSEIKLTALKWGWKRRGALSMFKIMPRGVAAFDNKNIIVSFMCSGKNREVWSSGKAWEVIYFTTDGGKTWQGTEKDKPIYIRQHGHASGIGGFGPDLLFISASGDNHYTCGGGFAARRMRFRIAKFTGKGWEITPDMLVSRDPRHCGGVFSALRLENGQLWTTWCLKTRFGPEKGAQIQTKYSNDGGNLWHSWRPGKTSYVDENPPSKGYGEKIRPFLAPYGETVMCLWGRNYFIFNGKEWSKPQPVCSGKGSLESVATVGKEKKDVYAYMTSFGGNGFVMHWDGSAWKKEKVPGITASPGLLTVSNGKLILIGVGSTVSKAKKKFPGRILMSTRNEDGAWTEAKEIYNEKLKISSIAAPMYSPPNFIPVAYSLPHKDKKKNPDFMDYLKIKVLRVPAN